MKQVFFIAMTMLIGISSCEKNVIQGKVKNDAKFAEELRSSPQMITFGNNNLVLTTYLWRDFMPIAEEGGSKLMCVNKLIDVDSIPIPGTIHLKRQYVIKDNEIWTAKNSEIRNDIDFILEGVVRDGPKWGPNIEVDVVCEFENSGIIHRVLAKSQIINRTE